MDDVAGQQHDPPRAAKAADLSTDRRAKLLAQRGDPPVPSDVAALLTDGRLAGERVADAAAMWRHDAQQLAEGHRDATLEAHLMALTLALLPHGLPGDDAGLELEPGRALVEAALAILLDPRRAGPLRCAMATRAAHEGDLEGASAWLAACDPASDDLQAYSAFVVAHATVANLRGEFAETVRVLGDEESAAPVEPRRRVITALLRAAALEHLGRIETGAVALLPALRWGPKARAAARQFVAQMQERGDPVPAKALAIASARERAERLIFWAKIALVGAAAAFLGWRWVAS